MLDSYYSVEELSQLGIIYEESENIKISRKSSIYTKDIIIHGANVRIDDYCFLSGHIEIGDYVHVAPFCLLNGRDGGIYVGDYVSLSSRVSIYSNSDDYSGLMMTGPLVPDMCKRVISGPVNIGRHCIVGANSFIMPGVNIMEGNAYGAFSFVKYDAEPWGINVGIPAKRVKSRDRELLKYQELI